MNNNMDEEKEPHLPKKRKTEMTSSSSKRGQVCIIHYDKSKCDGFTLLSDLKNPSERLDHLLSIRDKSLAQPIGSKYRMESICTLLPVKVEKDHGYHRDCYQHFTKHLDRLVPVPDYRETYPSEARTSRRTNPEDFCFAKDCIFCNKEGRIGIKRSGCWTSESTTQFASDSWKTVFDRATNQKDEKLLIRIRGYDLFAAGAHFHPSCRKKYLQDPSHWRSTNTVATLHQRELEMAHEFAFGKLCESISVEVISQQKIVKLSDLQSLYVATLESTPFPNPNYRGDKLKIKLESTFADRIAFCPLNINGQYKSQLVYSLDMKLETAVLNSFVLGARDTLSETAKLLRQSVMDAFENAGELKWPPTADQLDNLDEILPTPLTSFLQYVISGNVNQTSTQTNRIVKSIGQDICRAVTNGEWKLPKHIAICMALRHLYRSKQLTTIINRFGHCESYSFSLELETALAQALEQTSTMLSRQIIQEPRAPSIFHSEFDNFDQLVNSPTGAGSIHTAHGIMMQDLLCGDEDEVGKTIEIPSSINRTKDRSLKLGAQRPLPDCYVAQRKCPDYPVEQHLYPGSKGSVNKATTSSGIVWILLRMSRSQTGQELPSWAGFVSITGTPPQRLTTIDYYPVINHPITQYKTVQECLRYAEEATKEVGGQTYVITTFDLGVCMKAYPLVWNNPAKYDNHIIMIGTFHLACAYLKIIGKKMAGSGFSDLLLESGLIGSGSIQGVLSGKHYDRAMHCHKVLLESLERLLLEQFLITRNEQMVFDSLPETSKLLLERFVQAPSNDRLNEMLEDPNISTYINEYSEYRQSVSDGKLGKTAQFWMAYMNHIWLLLALIRSVKTNDFELYAECLHLLPDMFFSFNGHNYARYLSFFSVFIANLDTSHPGATDLLRRGAISVARSFIPGNRCQVDKTMEETFMKHEKSHGGAGGSGAGISGISGNYDAYQRWVKTTHERSKFVKTALSMIDMIDEGGCGVWHRDLRPTEIQKSDSEVCDMIDVIKGFINPFAIEEQSKLFCISSGAQVKPSFEGDILKAEEIGREAKEAFIKNRLEPHKDFFAPIKRLKLKTMEDMAKAVKVQIGKNKVIEYRQQGNIALQLLVKSEKLNMNMKELLKYPLTPVPYSIGTADGFMAKTNKSKGFNYLIEDVDVEEKPPSDDRLLIIEDGNALFYSLKEIPGTFGQICDKIFHMMPYHVDVVFSTDMYVKNSVKTMERQRRGNGEQLLIQGENTRRPKDWTSFLANEENKKQLIKLLYKEWSKNTNAQHLKGRKVIFICDGNAHCLTSVDGTTTTIMNMHDLDSTQEETDSRIVLYCMYGKQQGYQNIMVKSPDSDIFFILLHHIHRLEGPELNIFFDTGSGVNRKIVNITEYSTAHTPQTRAALLGLHAFSGCDTASAFKGKGKIRPIKILERMPRFTEALETLGNCWDIPEDLIDELEALTCVLYSKPRFKSVDALRYFLIQEKCDDQPISADRNIDIGTLPPCRKCLEQHIRRVNYQVGIWKNAHIAAPNIPTDMKEHGWLEVDGSVEPLWIDGDILPRQMSTVLQDVLESENQNNDMDDISEE
jgi:hypothetical protein